jgi:hypothetical protein
MRSFVHWGTSVKRVARLSTPDHSLLGRWLVGRGNEKQRQAHALERAIPDLARSTVTIRHYRRLFSALDEDAAKYVELEKCQARKQFSFSA